MGSFCVGLILCWFYLLNVVNLCGAVGSPSSSLTYQQDVVTCSKQKDCVSPGHVLMTFPNIQSEWDCQTICKGNDDCHAYTWYDEQAAGDEANKCHTLDKCLFGDHCHYKCHSGPKECFCEEPTNPRYGDWACEVSPEGNQGWADQFTECDLTCLDVLTGDHIDCVDQQWNPEADSIDCETEPTKPPDTQKCDGKSVPNVQHAHWGCHAYGGDCENHCDLYCDAGYTATDLDTLECNDKGWVFEDCKWCGYDKDRDEPHKDDCDCDGCVWDPKPKHFTCTKEAQPCDPKFPDQSSYSSSFWACMDGENLVVDPNSLEEGTVCKRRCGQGQHSDGSYTCTSDGKWDGDVSTCVDDPQELLYFFTTARRDNQYTTTVENPPNSNLMNSGVFTSMANGLHLFTLTLGNGGTGDIKLIRNNNVLGSIPTDNTKTNSLAVTVKLVKNDKVKIEGQGNLNITGVNLYSPKHSANGKWFWGNELKKDMDVQNIDQPIILENVDKSGLNYNHDGPGKVSINTGGVYMITLNLGSDDSSYASLDINNVKTLALGEDRDGRNVMSNFLLKEIDAGYTIQPTLGALSKIYDDNKQTQFTVTSLIDEVKHFSFCDYSSHYFEYQIPKTVIFDQEFLPNGYFIKNSKGEYTHPGEGFNPKRFYLLSATAFMGKLEGSAELKIEQWQESVHKWVTIAEATTTSSMRSMLQVSVIAQIDQVDNKIKVTAKGFMDEGPDKSHFATFCGFRLGV